MSTEVQVALIVAVPTLLTTLLVHWRAVRADRRSNVKLDHLVQVAQRRINEQDAIIRSFVDERALLIERDAFMVERVTRDS